MASFIACTLCLFLLTKRTFPCPTLSLCYTRRQEWRRSFRSAEKIPPFPPAKPSASVGNSWIRYDLWRNVTAEGYQIPDWQVCQMIISPCKLEPAPCADPLILNLRAMHQLGAGLLTASLLHSAVTVGTVVLRCVDLNKHCLTKDCTGGWHCISTCCCTGRSLWVWHLSAEGQTSVVVEHFPPFLVNSFVIKKYSLSYLLSSRC